MMHEEKKGFDPNDFPALQDFLAAYLHQDFGEEYSSAAEAVTAFLAEASGDQIQDVQDEWRRLQTMLAGRSLGEVQSAMQRLGAAWQPENEAEWKSVDGILSGTEA
jgi:CdiI immunity protein